MFKWPFSLISDLRDFFNEVFFSIFFQIKKFFRFFENCYIILWFFILIPNTVLLILIYSIVILRNFFNLINFFITIYIKKIPFIYKPNQDFENRKFFHNIIYLFIYDYIYIYPKLKSFNLVYNFLKFYKEKKIKNNYYEYLYLFSIIISRFIFRFIFLIPFKVFEFNNTVCTFLKVANSWFDGDKRFDKLNYFVVLKKKIYSAYSSALYYFLYWESGSAKEKKIFIKDNVICFNPRTLKNIINITSNQFKQAREIQTEIFQNIKLAELKNTLRSEKISNHTGVFLQCKNGEYIGITQTKSNNIYIRQGDEWIRTKTTSCEKGFKDLEKYCNSSPVIIDVENLIFNSEELGLKKSLLTEEKLSNFTNSLNTHLNENFIKLDKKTNNLVYLSNENKINFLEKNANDPAVKLIYNFQKMSDEIIIENPPVFSNLNDYQKSTILKHVFRSGLSEFHYNSFCNFIDKDLISKI